MQEVSYGAQWHSPPCSPEPGALEVSLVWAVSFCCSWAAIAASTLVCGAGCKAQLQLLWAVCCTGPAPRVGATSEGFWCWQRLPADCGHVGSWLEECWLDGSAGEHEGRASSASKVGRLRNDTLQHWASYVEGEQIFKNGTYQNLTGPVPLDHALKLPNKSSHMTQVLFKWLPLHQDQERVRFCECPFKAESWFPIALQCSAGFQKPNEWGPVFPKLGRPKQSSDPTVLREDLHGCSISLICGSPCGGCKLKPDYVSAPSTCLTGFFFISLVAEHLQCQSSGHSQRELFCLQLQSWCVLGGGKPRIFLLCHLVPLS